MKKTPLSYAHVNMTSLNSNALEKSGIRLIQDAAFCSYWFLFKMGCLSHLAFFPLVISSMPP